MTNINYIQCRHCQTDNEISLSFCSKCGSPLGEKTGEGPSGRRIAFLIIMVLLIFAVIFVYKGSYEQSAGLSSDEKEQYESRLEELEARLIEAREELLVLNSEGGAGTEIPDIPLDDLTAIDNAVAGWIMVSDPWGRQTSKFRAGMTRNGWIALPARACIGGNKWNFYPDSGGEYSISGGLWIGGDEVGLWQVSSKNGIPEVSEIATWNESEPVSWKSLESDNENELISLRAGPTSGFFTSATLPDDINEAGIFIQKGEIVGWTFGEWLAEGYMWPREDGVALEYNTWVRYFYDMTFAHGREEQFARALSLTNNSDILERLSAFVSGFKLQPRLSIEDIPEYLLPEEIIKKMRVLVTRAVRSGSGGRVVEILTSRVLKEIEDIYLFLDVVRIMADELGYDLAINEIEDTGRYIVRQTGEDAPALDKLHLQYYQGWLHDMVVEAELDEGWRVFNSARSYYPVDPQIHLLGVELALIEGDWQEAERLLYMMDYPAAYQDRVQLLALRISDMKGEEGKIVVNFSPGSNRVTIDAYVNGSVSQDFLVDTGATMVTITSSTAEALGLRVGPANHTLSTVGGTVKAAAVIIDSIEIDGWVEYDVRAFVVDIPNRPGLGLLGLNYLGRFRMDLKTDQGTLLLTPR